MAHIRVYVLFGDFRITRLPRTKKVKDFQGFMERKKVTPVLYEEQEPLHEKLS